MGTHWREAGPAGIGGAIRLARKRRLGHSRSNLREHNRCGGGQAGNSWKPAPGNQCFGEKSVRKVGMEDQSGGNQESEASHQGQRAFQARMGIPGEAHSAILKEPKPCFEG